MAQGARTRQFLDPAVVARLGTLELRARTIVEGFLTGLHRSPFKGFSVEFAEYRHGAKFGPKTPTGQGPIGLDIERRVTSAECLPHDQRPVIGRDDHPIRKEEFVGHH